MTLEHTAVREALIKSTLSLMQEGGLAAVKARAVADQAGVSVGTVYNLFGNVDQLMLAANLRIYDDLGAIGACAFHLDRRGVVGHHDDRPDAEHARRPGHALGVVAARVRDDPRRALGGPQLGDRVVGTAQLEGADGLERLWLEVRVWPALAGRTVWEQRGDHGHPAQALGGSLDVGQADESHVRHPPEPDADGAAADRKRATASAK